MMMVIWMMMTVLIGANMAFHATCVLTVRFVNMVTYVHSVMIVQFASMVSVAAIANIVVPVSMVCHAPTGKCFVDVTVTFWKSGVSFCVFTSCIDILALIFEKLIHIIFLYSFLLNL